MEVCRKSEQEISNSGIYRITCVANNHFYYGSSVNLKSRIQNHLSHLRVGSHRNKRLQRIFDKYGEASHSFEIVKYCDKSFLLDEEQVYLDSHISNPDCVNFCIDAKSPMRGVKFSDDHRRRIRESQSRNKYTFHYSSGHSESFNSLRAVAEKFLVRPSIVSRWFKREKFGRSNSTLKSLSVVKAEKTGDESVTLFQHKPKSEPWILAGATSRTQYYREKRRNRNLIHKT